MCRVSEDLNLLDKVLKLSGALRQKPLNSPGLPYTLEHSFLGVQHLVMATGSLHWASAAFRPRSKAGAATKNRKAVLQEVQHRELAFALGVVCTIPVPAPEAIPSTYTFWILDDPMVERNSAGTRGSTRVHSALQELGAWKWTGKLSTAKGRFLQH